MRNLLAYPDESRVWIYQADLPFHEEDVSKINEEIDAFCTQWTSHHKALRAIGGIMHDQFIVLVVDETQSSTSGCSIDKSIAFIKSLEQKYGRQLLLRDQVAWIDDNEKIHTISLHQLPEAMSAGNINLSTRVFDNLVSNRKEFITRWTVPLGESWMKRFL